MIRLSSSIWTLLAVIMWGRKSKQAAFLYQYSQIGKLIDNKLALGKGGSTCHAMPIV